MILDLQEGVQGIGERLTQFAQKLENALIPEEIKSLIEDVEKVVRSIHGLVEDMEKDTSEIKGIVSKSSADLQAILKHFSIA